MPRNKSFEIQSAKMNPIMSCMVIVLVVLLVVWAFLFAIDNIHSPLIKTPAPTPILATATPGPALYRVTPWGYLYSKPDEPRKLIAELPEGTLLKPANNAMNYKCEDGTEIGLAGQEEKAKYCFVEVVGSGETGWIVMWRTKKYTP